jgi:hypothetical protein
MGRLGDYFPNGEKQEHLKRYLIAGQVLYLFCPFTHPHKEKYLVLACGGDMPLIFVINSQISAYIQKRGLEQMQVLLRASEYAFLDHDSYVDCSNPRNDLSNADILKQILPDMSRVKGELNAASKAEIVRVVQGARAIAPIEKRMIVTALTSHT